MDEVKIIRLAPARFTSEVTALAYFEHLISLLRITLGNCVYEKEQFIIAEICVFQITVSPQQAVAR